VPEVREPQSARSLDVGIYLTLTWEDLYGRFDLRRFMPLIEASPHDWLATSLSILGALLSNQGLQPSAHRDAVAALLDGSDRDRAVRYFDANERQILTHPEAVALGMKLAALHARSGHDVGDASVLVPLLVGLNELTPIERKGRVATALHIHAAQQTLWPEDLVREFEIFHAYEPRLPDRIRYGFGEKFAAVTGLDAVDFSAYAFGIFAVFAQYKSTRDLQGVNFRALAESTGGRAVRPAEFELFLGLVSRTREELQRAFDGPNSTRLTLHDALAFRGAPLVRLEHGGAVPVWLEWLQEKVGSAPRYIIQNAINDNDEMARFRGALGEAFEDYFVSMLERMFPTGGGVKLHVREGLSGCDAIILADDAAFFLEITVSEPSIEAMWNGDEAGLSHFVAKRLTGRGKLRQLTETMEAFRAGTLELEGDRSTVRRLYPMIVGLAPLPQLLGLDAVLRRSIRRDNPEIADGTGDIRPVLFTCAKDWELLEQLLLTGRISIADTLDGWLATGPHSGLGDHLLRDRGFAGTRNAYLQARWVALGETLTSKAIELYGIRE
jgi:hypothetical protein